MEIRGNIHFIGNAKHAKALEKPEIMEKLQAAAETKVSEIVVRDKDNFVQSVSVRDFLADPDQFKAKGPALLSLQVGSETVVLELKKLSKTALLDALNTALNKSGSLKGESIDIKAVQDSAAKLVDRIRSKEPKLDGEAIAVSKLMDHPAFAKLDKLDQIGLTNIATKFGLDEKAITLITDLIQHKDLAKGLMNALHFCDKHEESIAPTLALYRNLLDNATKGTLDVATLKAIQAAQPERTMSHDEFTQLEQMLSKQAKGPKGAAAPKAMTELLAVVNERTRREPFLDMLLDRIGAPLTLAPKIQQMVRTNIFGKAIFESAIRVDDKAQLKRYLANYEALDKAVKSGKISLALAKELNNLPLDEKGYKDLLKLLASPDAAKLEAFIKHEHQKHPVIF